MKTIEQTAREYANEICEIQGAILTLKDEDIHNEIVDAYLRGVKDAEEFIKVEDELPEQSPYLGKDSNGKIELFQCCDKSFIRAVGIIEWRPISRTIK